MLRMFSSWLLFCFLAYGSVQAAEMTLETALHTIQTVDRGQTANVVVQKAWRRVAKLDAARIPAILTAMDDAGPIATNWLRAAVDAVAERQLKQQSTLPIKTLEAFLADRSHAARPRRLAFEWIVQVAPKRRQTLLAGMLDDPSLELRYDAVAAVIDQARRAASRADTQIALYRKALDASRDASQIAVCAAALGKLGKPINFVKHLGLMTKWHVVGPFDNRGGKGFDVVYPPEKEIDLNATYDGQSGRVAWRDIASTDAKGVVDLNKLIGQLKGAILYAAVDFYADAAGPAQVRLASFNATKVWFNGKQVDANEVYHTSMFLDQYRSDVQLKKGRNVILLKICQNEQTESWAQNWQFQCRVTDRLVKAIQPGALVNVSKE